MPLLPKKPAAMSFKDLMVGVKDVHQATAAQQGAQRFAPVREALKSATTHSEMAKKASDVGAFGKTPSGEPVRASVVESESWGNNIRATPISGNVNTGTTPEWNLVLHPESTKPELGRRAMFGDAQNTFPDFGMYWKELEDPDTYENLLGPQGKKLQKKMDEIYQSRSRDVDWYKYPKPSIYEINAERIIPGNPDPSMAGYRPVGADVYSLMYDMTRLPKGEFGISASELSPVNIPRRLRNTLSHYFGHGDYGNIMPFMEEGTGRGAISDQLFSQPIRDIQGERNYLMQNLPPKIAERLMNQSPLTVARLSDDEIAGMQLLREAQLARTYGPGTGDLGPFDTRQLRELAEPGVSQLSSQGSHDVRRAFGPHTLGRAIMTEQAIKRLLKGETAEEISYDLLKGVNPEAYKGRYAKGGLAAACA